MSQQIQITGGAKVRNLEGVLTGTSGVVNSLGINVPSGIPQLDGSGKILVSQLPNSVMEYKGSWNAATNTPTLADGTGNAGDVYLCNVAGTVNFGSGPIVFNVGDQVIYSGTIWQRASGATGTVTSVAVTESGDALTITGSPITTSGTINIGFAGISGQYINGAGGLTTFPTLISSIGLSMPSAFSVANSPLTANGTIAVTGAGNATQYVRGDGQLATLPTNGGGGGASVSYYLNGSINQGTIGGVTYYEMNKTPIIGAGSDFTKNTNGYIASFLTDANDPALLEIPAGNWNFETYFQASSGGGSPTFYIELYKYDGTTFTLISSNSANPKLINDGTNIEAYYSALAVPQTTLTLTDRLSVRIYVTTAGRTITLHTENGHLCQVITTFTTGLTALNGLTAQVQYLATGTSGTDFNISSATATHTFNLPIASALNTGKLSSSDWSVFNSKEPAITAGTTLQYYRGDKTFQTLNTTAVIEATNLYFTDSRARLALSAGAGISYNNTTGVIISTITQYTDALARAAISLTTTGTSGAATYNSTTGVFNIPNYTPDLSGYVTLGTTQTITGAKTFSAATVFSSTTTHSGVASFGTGSPTAIGTDGTLIIPKIRLYNGTPASIYSDFVSAATSNRSITVPDASGTMALTSNLAAYLPLTGGTLTGPLNGTTSTFSVRVNAESFNIPSSGGSISTAWTILRDQIATGDFGIYAASNLRLWIAPSGNTIIGGGSTDAGFKLEVIGTGRFTSSVTAASGLFTQNSNSIIDVLTLYNVSATSAGVRQRFQNGFGDLAAISVSQRDNGSLADDGQMQFQVASNSVLDTKMTILNSGNVGIGTITPSYKLDVGGATNTDSTARFSKTSEGSLLLGANRSTSNCPFIGSQNDFDFAFITNDTERVRITNGGNLGIGTNSPKLNGNGGTFTTIFNSTGSSWLELATGSIVDGNGGVITFNNTNIAGADKRNAQISGIRDGANNSGAITFTTWNSGTGAERMRIASNGAVGIGVTSTPISLLEVKGGTPYIRITDTSANTETGLVMDATGGNIRGGLTINYGTGEFKSFCGVTGNAYFQTFHTNGTEKMRITSGGIVYMGTTTGITGGGALQVNGNVNINGAFQINGVTIGGGGGSGVTGSGTTNYVSKWSSSSSLANSVLYDNGTNIGIGTASPAYSLDVNGSVGIRSTSYIFDAVLYSFNSSAGTYLGFGNNATGGRLFMLDNSTPLQLQAGGGNVLIGTTTNAGFRLDVNGPGRFSSSTQNVILYINGVSRSPSIGFQASGVDRTYIQMNGSNDLTFLVNAGGINALSLAYSTGAATFASSVTATSFFESSDSRLKIVISDYDKVDGIEKVPARLYLKNGKKELGYFAQDLQEILPSSVIEGEDGFLNLSYSQVHTAKIAYLEDKIAKLEELIKTLL